MSILLDARSGASVLDTCAEEGLSVDSYLYPNPLGSGNKKPLSLGKPAKYLNFRLPEHRFPRAIAERPTI
jgi:hypothetical protein